MSDTWSRDSFRAGGGDYGLLDEMVAQEGAAEKEKGETERGDGQGVASFNANPKPGDELYDTLHQARAENTERHQAAQQQAPEVSNESAVEFAALIAASSPAQQAQQPEGNEYRQAQQQVTEPDAERQQPATFHALKAEQAAAVTAQVEQEAAPANEGPTRPGQREDVQPDGLMADYVSDEARQSVEANRQQSQQQQRSRTMGLAL